MSEPTGDGILRFSCPCCGYVFRYKRGRVRHPNVKEVDKWLTKAQCRNCGVNINAYNRSLMTKESDRVQVAKLKTPRG